MLLTGNIPDHLYDTAFGGVAYGMGGQTESQQQQYDNDSQQDAGPNGSNGGGSSSSSTVTGGLKPGQIKFVREEDYPLEGASMVFTGSNLLSRHKLEEERDAWKWGVNIQNTVNGNTVRKWGVNIQNTVNGNMVLEDFGV